MSATLPTAVLSLLLTIHTAVLVEVSPGSWGGEIGDRADDGYPVDDGARTDAAQTGGWSPAGAFRRFSGGQQISILAVAAMWRSTSSRWSSAGCGADMAASSGPSTYLSVVSLVVPQLVHLLLRCRMVSWRQWRRLVWTTCVGQPQLLQGMPLGPCMATTCMSTGWSTGHAWVVVCRSR